MILQHIGSFSCGTGMIRPTFVYKRTTILLLGFNLEFVRGEGKHGI